MKNPTDVFDEWAKAGKDKGMETGHRAAVDKMLAFALQHTPPSFSAIDAGCGNGWLTRLLAQHDSCKHAQGVDGAANMIKKAKSIDPAGSYEHADLLHWHPQKSADLVISMEVFYYFPQPILLIQHVVQHWLQPQGRLIIGVDHYAENTASLNWAEECGINCMTTLSIDAWQQAFRQSGLQQVKSWQVGQAPDWAGTLIVTGCKA